MGTIAFENVSKTFSGQTEVRALDGISLTISEGEFVALLGPSGCGKSTLLNLLAGFEKTTEGTLLFDGKTVTRPGPDRGVVFQEAALFPWLNVWQNVIFGPQVQGVRARRIRIEGAQPVEAGRTGSVCRCSAGAIIGRHAPARRHRAGAGDVADVRS